LQKVIQEVFNMSSQYVIQEERPQVPPYDAAGISQGVLMGLEMFLYPLLVALDERLDKRLVRTFLQSVALILRFRDRINGLLLSELGGYLLGPEQAPAGKKRLENLLLSKKWKAQLIKDWLLTQADARLQSWQIHGWDALGLWDHSPWEKPESQKSEDLCAVRSSKGKRLTHIKPGFFSPPHGPIMVPGLQWLTVALVGRNQQQDPLQLACCEWWTTRGVHASHLRDVEVRVLVVLVARWGRRVLHVFDQGWASGLWIGVLLGLAVRFVLRWRPKYHLIDAAGNKRLAWKILQGKRGWSERWVWDSRRARWVKSTVLAAPVRHPEHREEQFFLVVCRSQGRAPWYLLTSEPITTAQDAWDVVWAYVRRWQIEQVWRFEKSEMGIQSPRLWSWEAREKLLLIATLAYAFLLSLLDPAYEPLRLWLLRRFDHRTGRRLRRIRAPLYRLRRALSRLWQQYPPCFEALAPPGVLWVQVTPIAEEPLCLPVALSA
jgi:hypothetical protein